jgi:xanthine phosphoribosyltransferase
MRYLDLTWQDVEEDLKKLRNILYPVMRNEINGIIAIARGGLIPATIFSYMSDVRNVKTVQVKGYEHTARKEKHTYTCEISVQDSGAGWLIMDDVLDTGMTIDLVRRSFPKAIPVALCSKAIDAFCYCPRTIEDDIWVRFPWGL